MLTMTSKSGAPKKTESPTAAPAHNDTSFLLSEGAKLKTPGILKSMKTGMDLPVKPAPVVGYSNLEGSVRLGDVQFDMEDGRSTSSRFSGSDRSWTPSAVKAKIVNWPAWLSINCFCAAICFLILVHGALTTGYITSVLTTIEKRFEITSKTSGLVISSYEFGSLLSVLFVSYLGSRGHIPRFVGLGAIILALGSLLFSLPHFISSPPSHNVTDGVTRAPDTCLPHQNQSHTPEPTCDENEPNKSAGAYVFVLILAQVLLGIGGSPIFTLGTTYIDNHVPKENASVYLACMYVMVAIGPVLGFFLGSLMLSTYVNPPEPADLPDSAFIGLWWGGFVILGGLYFVASLPLFGFPKRLPSANATPPEPSNDDSTSTTSSIRKLPVSMLRLVSNSVYMVASLNACMDLAIVSGFTVYLPKYFETQFGFTKSKASMLTGGVAVPGAIVGILVGGLVLKKYKLQLRGLSSLIVVINFVALAMLTMFFFFGCDNLDLAGVFSTYNRINRILPIPNPLQESSLNLTDPCNVDCACSPLEYQPVCGRDHKTYFSPCFAGCSKPMLSSLVEKQSFAGKVWRKEFNYTSCACILNDTIDWSSVGVSEDRTVMAWLGTCDSGCKMLMPFLILLFVLTAVASCSQMPLLMVTLRAVTEEEKAFALGLQVVMLRLLAYIPSPVLFGSVIDTTCLVWKPSTCHGGTACLLYDIETFRYRYGSIAMCLKVVAVTMSVILWQSIKRRGRGAETFSAPITMSEIAHRLGEWENLHLVGCRAKHLRSWVSDDSLYSRSRSPKRHQKTMSC